MRGEQGARRAPRRAAAPAERASARARPRAAVGGGEGCAAGAAYESRRRLRTPAGSCSPCSSTKRTMEAAAMLVFISIASSCRACWEAGLPSMAALTS